ncbi:MAG TPA: molybdenum cofactor guanylyltransferase [Thermoanaerobaculia bacterium]|nr:molybdenum cofactor guanylyltransferase [Thermoanaerobaculia bacterium]
MNGYILIGGVSRRMGRSKVELFLDRVVDAARPVFDELVAVHRPGGDAHPSLRTIFEEPHEGMAPIFGVIRALEDARAKCFILGVDYPLLTTDVLRELVARFEQSPCRLLVPMWSGLPQMLCAGYDAALLPELAGRIELKPLIRQAWAEVVAEDELRAHFAGEPLMNVNTPEELQEAEARYGR